MDTTLDLNQLILEAPSYGAQRGEVVLNVGRDPTGPSDVRFADTEKPSFVKALFGRREIERKVLVRCGRSIAIEPLSFKSEDVSTEVTFVVSLKLDLVTPAAGDVDALRQLGFAFHSATLEIPGSAASGMLASTPSGMFTRELSQWLRSTYRSREKLDRYSEAGWMEEQNRQIASWIRTQYGLDAIVKLKVEVESEHHLGPVAVKVETNACDSDAPLTFTINIGCELISGGVFRAPTLTRSDLERRTRDAASLFLRQNVTLQQYRFEEAWRQDLKAYLAEDLRPFNRKISEFTLPLQINAPYSRGPHSIRAGEANFEPAGWNGEDRISFSGDAQIVIENAAIFEAGRSLNDLLNIKAQLTAWLRNALQEAISEELHTVHDQRVGYADMLANWTEEDATAWGEPSYKARIEANLGRRAKAAGLDASTIIATPNRPEMALLSGAEIRLEGLALPCKEPGATLNFDSSATIKIKSFKDIRDLLNRTHDPLQAVEKDFVEKTLKQAARKISYLKFYQSFDSGPWPDDSTGHDTGCSGWLEDQLRSALKEQKIELVSFTPTQTATEHYEVFKRLREAAPQEIDINTEMEAIRNGSGYAGVIGTYRVRFQLDITGLAEKEIGSFFRDWGDVRGQNTEYSAVVEYVRAHLRFTPEDKMSFRLWEDLSSENRQKTQMLVGDRLNALLAKNFGLSGRANNASVLNVSRSKIVVLEEGNEIEALEAEMNFEKEARIAKAKAHAGAIERIAIGRANTAVTVTEKDEFYDPDTFFEEAAKRPEKKNLGDDGLGLLGFNPDAPGADSEEKAGKDSESNLSGASDPDAPNG